METGTKGANAKGPVTPVAASGAGKRKAVQPSPPAAKVKAGMGALASASSKKKAKPATSSFKVHFDSPFGLKWPPVAEDVRTEVVERLSRELGEYKRVRVKKERKARKTPSRTPTAAGGDSGGDAAAASAKSAGQAKKKRGKKAKKDSHGATTTTSTTTATAVPDEQNDVMEVEEGQHKSHTHDGTPEPEPANEGSRRSKRAKVETEADVEARKNAREKLITKRQEVREKCGFMAVGINAVTKALENKQLEVVVVCKDVEPARLVQHVPLQAFLTDVPLVPLCGDLSLQLGAIFGIRTVMAIGFKKGVEHPHADLVDYLKAKAIPLNIPWLLPAKQAAADGATPAQVVEPLALHPFQARVAEPKRTSADASQKQGSSKQRGRKPNA